MPSKKRQSTRCSSTFHFARNSQYKKSFHVPTATRKILIDSFNKALYSYLEKTFIDCLFKPESSRAISKLYKRRYTRSNLGL